MVKRKATEEAPYAYDIGGLENVFLEGISVNECPKCAEKSPVIPRIEELHQVMVHDLLRQPQLTGNEIRFLRKHVGLSAREFADKIKITPECLSRVENGHELLKDSTEKLIRAVVAAKIDWEQTQEVLLGEDTARRTKATWFILTKKQWQAKAA